MKSFLNAWKNAFGFKGHKKKYGVCLGAVLLTMLCTGCKFNSEENVPVAVYGPPEDIVDDYDPSENLNVDVYGPPEDLFDEEESEEDSRKNPEEEIIPDFHPEENMDVCVYGPPEDM
ncbi:MAG: hypothetical protein MJ105_08075 [Lachnospiraceae bacterium]|nr:hypothetical protein [Lachnospiraceae bacterium]